MFFNENVWISIKISLKFVPKGPINNIPALVKIMAWRRSGDKPLSEPMMVSWPTHICVTRPQWVDKVVNSCIVIAILFYFSRGEMRLSLGILPTSVGLILQLFLNRWSGYPPLILSTRKIRLDGNTLTCERQDREKQWPPGDMFKYIFSFAVVKIKETSISSDNGFTPYKRQAIMISKDGPVYWHMSASLFIKDLRPEQNDILQTIISKTIFMKENLVLWLEFYWSLF